MKLLIASVAAIALSASPALALAQTAPPEHGTTTTTHVEETTHPTHPTQHHTTSMHHHTTVEHHHSVHCGCPGHHYQAHHKVTTKTTTTKG